MKPSKLLEHFHNRICGTNVVGHDKNSLRAGRAFFDSRATLPKIGFVSVDKLLLMASYQVA